MSRPTNTTRIAVSETKISSLQEKVKKFVTLDRFTPIEKLVYGLVGTLLLAIVGAGLSLILK